MKFLITGGSGFVGSRLADYLARKGNTVYALDCHWNEGIKLHHGISLLKSDLTDSRSLHDQIGEIDLDGVFHLAAQASVQYSWDNPVLTYHVNAIGTASLMEVLKKKSTPPKLLFISSGEVYGTPRDSVEINENLPYAPCNPYGLSKVFGEEMIRNFYPSYTIARPFNIIGPGQSDRYAIPSFCRQAALIAKGKAAPVIFVGNLKVIRNFLDIRDVLSAYELLMRLGKSGEFYNVAAFDSICLDIIFDYLKQICPVPFTIEVDPKRVRAAEAKVVKINTEKIRKLGWEPLESLNSTIRDMFNHFMEHA